MALLRTIVAGAALFGGAGACYSPELRDCTVSCESRTDCGAGQLCNADHLCTAPDIACVGGPHLDAGPGSVDDDAPIVPPTDAAMIDAAQLPAMLVLAIEDKGSIVVTNAGTNVGTCDSDPPQMGHCTYPVPLGATLQLLALPHVDRRFDKWTTEACKDQAMSCTLAIRLTSVHVTAKFRK